jgi:DNA mismatch endonuclease (patch repair protein)
MKCKLCNKEFKTISWKHLFFKHKISIEQYDILFGEQKHSTTKSTSESVQKGLKTKEEKGYKYIPWNKGLTKETDLRIGKISKDRMGENNPVHRVKDKEKWKKNAKNGRKEYDNSIRGKTLEEIHGVEKAQQIKKNQSIAALVRPSTAGHHVPHTEETKNKLRKATIEHAIKNKKIVSKLQIFFYEQIKNKFPQYNFVFQYLFGFYLIDIAIPQLRIAIEVDGDFWHVNESKGYEAKYDSQKRNLKNDKCKNSFLLNKNWNIIRFWECDIKENIDLCFEKLFNFIKECEKKNAL